MFTFQACGRFSLSGNPLKGDVLGSNIRLEQMKRKDLSVKTTDKTGFTIDPGE